MAKTKVAQLESDFSKVIDAVDDVKKSVDGMNESINETSTAVNKTTKSVDKLSKGFRGVGVALKATGIKLFLDAFQFLKDLFMQNTTFADNFAGAVGAITTVFNDLIDFIVENVVPVFEMIFENPTEALSKLGDAIKQNIIERFESAIEVVESLAFAFSAFMRGDFETALFGLKNAGKEYIDVLTGIDDTTGKAAEAVKKLGEYAENTGKRIREGFDAAKEIAQLDRAAAIREQTLRQTMLSFQNQAELQRQIRDDVNTDINTRIAANEKIAVLQKQQMETEMQLLNEQISLQQKKIAFNKNDHDARVALAALETERLDIIERINGQASEQIVNATALKNEMMEINQIVDDGKRKNEADLKLAETEFIESEYHKLLIQKQIADEIYQTERAAMDKRIEMLNENTLAYANAIKERNDLDTQYQIESAKRDQIVNDSKVAMYSGAALAISKIFDEQSAASKAVAAADIIYNTYAGIMKTVGTLGWPAAIVPSIGIAAQGVAALRKVLSTTPENASGGDFSASNGGGGGDVPPTPNAGVIRDLNAPNEQLTAVIDAPVRAYVVTKDVTTGQSFDRNTIRFATLNGG